MERQDGSPRTLPSTSPALWLWRTTCAGWSGCAWRQMCSPLCPHFTRPGSCSPAPASGRARRQGARGPVPEAGMGPQLPKDPWVLLRTFPGGGSHCPRPRGVLRLSEPRGPHGSSPHPPIPQWAEDQLSLCPSCPTAPRGPRRAVNAQGWTLSQSWASYRGVTLL